MKFIKPRRFPEANIQAELYRRLTNSGIKCLLEYTFKEFHLRADLIVIRNDEIVCACEVKNRNPDKEINTNSRQFQKYQKLGIPIFYCTNWCKISEITRNIYKLYFDI